MLFRSLMFACAMVGAALFLSNCKALTTAYNAVLYETTESGEASNVVVVGDYAYAALAGKGLGIHESATGRRIALVPPPPGTLSVDDLAAADGLLFVLDARKPGFLSTMDIRKTPARPVPASTATMVNVEPFTGVSASNGIVVVSGGTSRLEILTYTKDGKLGATRASTDLGRGQPDVLVAGDVAYVSTHFSGPRFGVALIRLKAPPAAPEMLGKLELREAGFTSGGIKPANFPIETALVGSTLLTAHGGGLAVIDVGNKTKPRLLKNLDPGFAAVNVDARGNLAAVVGGGKSDSRVALVDISNPAQAKIIKTIPLGKDAHATSVTITNEKIVIAARKRGVIVLNR